MSKPKIVRLFGKADEFEVEFTRAASGWWECDVPADLRDGCYAATFCAVNEYGETAYWTGELFMCNGACVCEMHDGNYQIWSAPERYTFETEEKYKIEIRKGCSHGSNKFLCR
ncbi:MAG: Ig-like domain repeat protein [Faecalibacterium sp.]|nr:Ig-like domain repeat protein [Ruminococcus sp.]MCM1392119.1 Ig-like domain repeat protein [Ruminococcus sp.]MCM1485816.1 Ig-like domain repeat protein [Faecalibacterium sp.]